MTHTDDCGARGAADCWSVTGMWDQPAGWAVRAATAELGDDPAPWCVIRQRAYELVAADA